MARVGYIIVPFDDLHERLMLPSVTLITGIAVHHDTHRSLRIYLEHPAFDEIEAGGSVPGYDLNYLTDTTTDWKEPPT